MYTIRADGQILYAPHLAHEGCGVFSPKLTVELNRAGSLEYTMPPTNVLYSSVNKLKTIITVHQNGEELFRGRVLHDEKDFYKQKKVYCEGELAFLLDSQQRPYNKNVTGKALFEYFVNNHNSRVEAEKKFTVGDITVDDTTTPATFTNENHKTTFDEITEQLIEVYGGYLKTRVSGSTRYIDWLKEYGKSNTQIIEFGKNLLDITEYITAENIFTVIIPLGKMQQDSNGNQTGKLGISSVNDGKDYLESESAISLFGRIERSVEWTEVNSASELKTLGQASLDANIEMSVTLNVQAVDLHILDVNTEQLHLGDYVQVVSAPHGLNKTFQCTKITYDLESPDLTEYVFGATFTGLTDKQINDQKGISKSVAVVQNAAVSVGSAVSQATEAAAKADQAVLEVNTVVQQLPDTYLTKTDAANTYATKEELEDVSGSAGENGATFTPSVDSSGNLSWTNDKELENPDTVNIKGPPGQNGNPGENGQDGISCTHSWNGTVLTITSASGTSSADLKGEKGDPAEGGSGTPEVHIGPEPPTGDETVWIDTDEEAEAGESGREVIEAKQYVILDSITSDGASWFNTGIIPTNNIVAEFTNFTPADTATTSYEVYLGSQTADNANDSWQFRRQSTVTNFIFDIYGQTRVAAPMANGCSVKLEGTGITVNGSKVSFSPATISATYPLFIFASNTGGSAFRPSVATFGGLTIKNGAVLKRDYVPVKRVYDGAIGLYDRVTGTFFENMGTGVCTGGVETGEYIAYVFPAIYPVGSIYMSVNPDNPAALFGGTWEQIQGKFLLAADETYPAGSEGGEEEHTLTVEEMPEHNHSVPYAPGGSASWGYSWTNGKVGSSEVVGMTGGDQPHNNMPPYLAVYIWKRTA